MAKKGKQHNGIHMGPKTLGPLTELENHLPPEWWKSLFNAVYLKTDADVVEDDSLTVYEVDYLQRIGGMARGDHILDLCCGQGRHTLEFARRGFKHMRGLDRSRYLVRLAKQRAEKENMDVKFHEGDARKLRFQEDSLDFVLVLGNSFGYFEASEDDAQVLQSIRRCLHPGGMLILDLAEGAWMRENFQTRSWEWIDNNQFVCREREMSTDQSRLISREVVVDAEKGVLADQFYAERLYDESSIRALLENSGFETVHLHTVTETKTNRNQDLGMMSHRMWITALNSPKKRKKVIQPVRYKAITVILGDPELPDMVKLNGKFNEEDYSTIAKLKSAMSGLSQYTVEYKDNHASLLKDLHDNPPEFVLNLCDEGFLNDPLKELHVAAYLEMLKIPYTGAVRPASGSATTRILLTRLPAPWMYPFPRRR